MRMLPAVLLTFALLTGAAPAKNPESEPAPPRRVVLKGPDCLDPSAARDWRYVDGDQLVVDAGRRKYRITLSGFCTELGHATGLVFKGDGVTGRICGHVGERLVFRGMQCRIDRVELIDAETYKQVGRRERGSVTTQGSTD